MFKCYLHDNGYIENKHEYCYIMADIETLKYTLVLLNCPHVKRMALVP